MLPKFKKNWSTEKRCVGEFYTGARDRSLEIDNAGARATCNCSPAPSTLIMASKGTAELLKNAVIHNASGRHSATVSNLWHTAILWPNYVVGVGFGFCGRIPLQSLKFSISKAIILALALCIVALSLFLSNVTSEHLQGEHAPSLSG